MSIKNAGLLTLVAVLVFGMASSPMLQNFGLAYAASHKEMDDTDAVDDTDEVRDSDKEDDRDEEYEHTIEVEIQDPSSSLRQPPSKDRVEYRVENFERYCELSDSEREEFWAKYDRITDEQKQMHDRYCGLAYAASHQEMDDTDAVDDTDKVRDSDKEDDRDEEYEHTIEVEIQDPSSSLRQPPSKDRVEYRVENFERYCELSDSEREEFWAQYDRITDEQKQMHDRYCAMTDEEKEEFRKTNRDVMMDFKEKRLDMVDKKKFGQEFVRDFDMRIATLCEMSEEELQRLLQNNEFLREYHERIAEYCNMSEEEREEYRMTHQDMMEDYSEDFGQMRDRMMDSKKDMKMQKMMRNFDVTAERHDEIRDKFKEKHSDLTDVQRDELRQKIKTKYSDYYEQKIKTRHDAMSDLHKDLIIKRHAEMKEFKSELRLKYNDMTEDERIQFQAEFRDKVSDKRFSWISPHKQMQAGISVDQIECREGLNLVLHASSGKAMCLKSSTAERMIDREIAVPAN